MRSYKTQRSSPKADADCTHADRRQPKAKIVFSQNIAFLNYGFYFYSLYNKNNSLARKSPVEHQFNIEKWKNLTYYRRRFTPPMISAIYREGNCWKNQFWFSSLESSAQCFETYPVTCDLSMLVVMADTLMAYKMCLCLF